MNEPQRKQLVGLLTADPSKVIPSAHNGFRSKPGNTYGNVGAYIFIILFTKSQTLNRIGSPQGGLNRKGQTVYIPMLMGNNQ